MRILKMPLVRAVDAVHAQRRADPYGSVTRVDPSPLYDFVISLRALFDTRTFEHSRSWAAQARSRLDPGARALARTYFQGRPTALGLGAMYLIPDLRRSADPEDLVRAVREADPRELALKMISAGDTGAGDPRVVRRAVYQGNRSADLDRILRRSPADWARRCRVVLSDPPKASRDLADLFHQYSNSVFSREVGALVQQLSAAAASTKQLLSVLPAVEVIERITGGFTLSPGLVLRRVVLAPSVFIYPFLSARIDEERHQAIIVFGVHTDHFRAHHPETADADLLRLLKVVADPARLLILRLLTRGPLSGTELVARVALSQPTLHHHLSQLRSVGLIHQERTRAGMVSSLTDRATLFLGTVPSLVAADQHADAEGLAAVGGPGGRRARPRRIPAG